ncbi:MAG: arginine--tRNA ligase [Candidatus Pacebacteria bacterium]|nr:arginine--tRNA ligase [Candidatus Paceibacterota bacterium]
MIEKEIKMLIKETVKKLLKEKELSSVKVLEILIEIPEKEIHGDYSINIAFLLAKTLKQKPMKIAKDIVQKIEKEANFAKIKKVEAIEPGFINFWLSGQVMIANLGKILKEKDKYGSLETKDVKKTLVIDYSSPNIAKSFGVGHLRSTVIGQSLYNIYKFLGWKVIGDNHLGDWGTQFGKLIVAIKKWNKKEIEGLTIGELEKLYVKFHQEAKIQPELLEQAREWFKKLEQGDREAKEMWQFCVSLSLKEFNKIYDLLGIKIDHTLGESFYQDKMEAVIQDSREKNIAQESEGALVVFLPKDKTPFMVLKSDGATTYGTRDLATIKYRMEKWKPDLIIWEVGADQKFYFKQLFKVAEMLGYGRKEQFKHIAHGLIRWTDAKFSTREGDTIHLEGILTEAIKRASKIIDKSKIEESTSQKEKEEIARQIGIGAIKYNDLSRHYSKDIIFDWESMLSLDGNSGPYLQYTAVRCQSVLDKANRPRFNLGKVTQSDCVSINKEERLILKTLYNFPSVVKKSALHFSPNLICNFVFDLAQKYNLFYEKYPVLAAKTKKNREFRIALTAGTRQVLENCLTLLGISVPKKM